MMKGMAKGRLLGAALMVTSLLAGCHSASGGAAPQRDPAPSFHPGKVPTPPTADQIDPNSPAAVLNGTSTTQTTPTQTTPTQSPRNGSQAATGASTPPQ